MSKHTFRYIVVGALKGAHGVRGEVRVKSFTADPEAVFTYGPLVDADGKTLITPVSARLAKDHFIVRPKETLQKEDWDARKGQMLHVLRSQLPDADDDEFYIEDLVGMEVFDGGASSAGRVKSVQNFGADDLLEISVNGLAQTVYVPFTRVDVPTVDMAARRIIVPDLAAWSAEGEPE